MLRKVKLFVLLSVFIITGSLLGYAGSTMACGIGEKTAEGWTADLEVFEKTLPRRHKNLFFSMKKEDYLKRLAEIEEALPDLTDAEVEIRLRKLLADVGDAHTDLRPRMETVYPLDFTRFEEGLFLRRADTAYADAVGMELIAIDGTSLKTVWQKISEITPHDNEAQLWNSVPMYLSLPYYLKALGIVEGETATFLFRNGENEVEGFDVQEMPRDSKFTWHRYLADIVEPPEDPQELPLYMKKKETVYRMIHRPEEELLYIQYDSCREDPGYPFEEFLSDLQDPLSSPSIEKLVVDLRFNGGGDSRVLQPLIRILENDYKRGRSYGLYVVIGRGTFSSAILNAVDLKQRAGAVLVGESTAGKPNHYGELKQMELPYSGLVLHYSTKYFRLVEGDPKTLQPDISVPWSFEDFSSWRDGVMETIREL